MDVKELDKHEDIANYTWRRLPEDIKKKYYNSLDDIRRNLSDYNPDAIEKQLEKVRLHKTSINLIKDQIQMLNEWKLSNPLSDSDLNIIENSYDEIKYLLTEDNLQYIIEKEQKQLEKIIYSKNTKLAKDFIKNLTDIFSQF